MPVVMKRREQVCDLCSHTLFIQVPFMKQVFDWGIVFHDSFHQVQVFQTSPSWSSIYIYIQILHMNVWIVCLGPNIGSQWEPNHYYFTIRDLKMNLHDNPLRIRGNGQDPNNYMYRCKGNKYVWPIGSMYGVFTYIWLKFTVKVCKYHTWILCVRLKICSFLGDGSGVSSTHITGR